VLIVSDHGAWPVRATFNIDTWLKKHGYLKGSLTREIKNGIKSAYRNLSNLVRSPLKLPPLTGKPLRGRIIYAQSRAFSAQGVEQGIFLNVKGRMPAGIVDRNGEYDSLRERLIAQLEEVEEPHTGERLFEWVKPREDIYTGEFSDLAPDIMFGIKKGYSVEDGFKDRLFDYNPKMCAAHDPEGIFIARGPAIKSGCTLEEARIIDLAPTILYLLGMPIDTEMDGTLLKQMIRDDFLKAHPPETFRYSDVIDCRREEYAHTADEEEALKEKLAALGYM
jgi:predicted AlkP superfamily phosphohydrolase/phosphomutase